MEKFLDSPPSAGRRHSTSTKTVVGSSTPDRKVRGGSAADPRQSPVRTSNPADPSDPAPENIGDRNSGSLTQRVHFDLKSIHSTSTPCSGSEGATDSDDEQGSDGESTGEDGDEEYDPDTTRDSISVPKDLDGD
ncbi:hypothetical protein BGX30_005571 [Mortierella sp. GBA39]|nr:hypothetical protein BGX30_005571 [Mortierella sp. GBA39]